MNTTRARWFAFVFTCCIVITTFAGRPLPAHRQSQGQRDARQALLNFQNALAANRWDDALALCSRDVRAKAKEWPSAQQFFTDTMPIEHVLSHELTCWMCGEKFYGMFETLSDYNEPRLDWYWGLASDGGAWVVDYPPLRMSDYVVQRKAMLKERDEKNAPVQRAISTKAAFISTRLVPLTNKFVLGQPMRFRVEVTNAGPTSVMFQNGGLSHYGLEVRDARGTLLTNTAGPAQVMVRTTELPPHSSFVLADALDITANHRITAPGKYEVRFDGSTFGIGERVPDEETDRFGRNLNWAHGGYMGGTNRFPSNVVKIEVRR